MVTGSKSRQAATDRDLLEFGRAYLSEAFPNPDRNGCPQEQQLRLLARNPRKSPPWISDHLTCCSPCFNAYMAHLEGMKVEAVEVRRVRFTTSITRWLSLAAVAAVLVITYVLFSRSHNSHTGSPVAETTAGTPPVRREPPAPATYASVVIDLSNASPQRGGHKGKIATQEIPSSAVVDLKLLLPLGSEKTLYSVKLGSSHRVIWSGSGEGHTDNGQMSIRVHADFSHIPSGNYDLIVISREFHLSVPVVLKIAPSGGIQRP